MKLWQKDKASLETVEAFTVGRDREFDLMLAPFDILGSIAHVKMLGSIGLLADSETSSLVTSLKKIYDQARSGEFVINDSIEDVHSQVEFLLTQELGEAGKKIHSARSRNDQVLLDIRLFLRDEIRSLSASVYEFFGLLQKQGETYKGHLYPGYTHLQVAMPSSFGLWFGAYAESLVDDMEQLYTAFKIVNKNPLGSAAGYGSSFPIDRNLTKDLLGFEELNHNVVYAQMGRGRAERVTAQALSSIADTLSRLCMDACLYMGQDMAFISFPPELTTGSSIMPHKKNPDVFELTRSYCNRIKSLPNEVFMMTTNLPSGYHRDLQLLKEHLFPAFKTMQDCIRMTSLMLSNIIVRENILDDEKYKYIFSVEAVNKLVLEGIPFRDAYRQVGKQIEEGSFEPVRTVNHTHQGSIGDPGFLQVKTMMDKAFGQFNFERLKSALDNLLL